MWLKRLFIEVLSFLDNAVKIISNTLNNILHNTIQEHLQYPPDYCDRHTENHFIQ